MDQQPQTKFRIDWNDIKGRVVEIARFLPSFFMNPFENIKHVPSWDWTTVILLQIMVGMVCGVVTGLVVRSFLAVLAGIFISPFVGLFTTFFWALLLYYAFILIEKTQLEFRKVYVVVVLGFMPVFAFGIFASFFKPIYIIGIVFSGLLLTNAFTENFLLDRQKVKKVVTAMAVLASIVIFWRFLDDRTSSRYQMPDNYKPESLEQLKKELGAK